MSKKRNRPSKPRTERLYGTTVHEVSSMTVIVNPVTGAIEFGHPMENAFSEVTYERTKGPKVLRRIPQSAQHVTFEAKDALTSHFDVTLAVDTNTRTINGREVSVTAVVSFEEAPPPPGAKACWKNDILFCWEFIDLKTDKKENFGWVAALEELSRRDKIPRVSRVGMIVDSDLGNIPAFNARKLPIFENFYLPDGVQLIYASADAGSESIVNQVLKLTDYASTQTLDSIARGDVAFNDCTRPSQWYAGYRIISVDVVNTGDVMF